MLIASSIQMEISCQWYCLVNRLFFPACFPFNQMCLDALAILQCKHFTAKCQNSIGVPPKMQRIHC